MTPEPDGQDQLERGAMCWPADPTEALGPDADRRWEAACAAVRSLPDDRPAGAAATAREAVGTVVLSALMLVALRAAFGNFVVDGPSMEPTLVGGQRIWVTRLDDLWTQAPARGDIIVFQAWDQDEPFVKRVVGLPGETVEVHDERVWIDGSPLVEPYLREPTTGTHGPVLLGNSELFVLGDNRDQSADSRTYGSLPVEAVSGTARLRYWPPNHVSLLGSPRPALAGGS